MPRITDLPELTNPSDDDILVIDDNPASGTTTKKVTKGNLTKDLAKKADLEAHVADIENPHAVTAEQIGVEPGATANATDEALRDRATHTGTQPATSISDLGSAISTNTDVTANTAARHTHANKAVLDAMTASFTTDDETKLDGIATGATANATNAQLRDRSTHTGTQTASTISDFSTAADARIAAQKGASHGLATLDGSGKVPSLQLPSYVDDVEEYANLSAFPGTGDTGKIYMALDSNRVYRWGGSAYVEISPSPGSTDAVPEGSTNKYFTDERAADAAPVQSVAGKQGAVSLIKSDVGLGNVDNTADSAKPISSATQSALNAKADASTLTSHTSNTANPHSVTKAQVGLSNVPNTDATARANHTGTQSADSITDGATNKAYTAAEKTKLGALRTNSGRSLRLGGSDYVVVPHNVQQKLGSLGNPMSFYIEGKVDTLTGTQCFQATEGRHLTRISNTGIVSGGPFGNIPTSTASYPAGSWLRIGWTYDGINIVKLFVNGALVKTSTASSTASGSNDFYYGKRNGMASTEVTGNIDNAHMWNVALTDAEMLDMHTRGVVPKLESLVLQHLFDEETGSTLYDTATLQQNGSITGATYSNDIWSADANLPRIVAPVRPVFTYFKEARHSVTVGVTGSGADYICTGTDDQAVVLQALQKAQSLGHALSIGAGTYNWNAQVLFQNVSNVHIHGAGKGVTILKRVFSGTNSMLELGSGSGPTVSSGIEIHGITVDLNNVGSGWGIVASWCKNVIFQDCEFKNPSSSMKAAVLVGKFSGSSDAFEANNIRFVRCDFDYSAASGLGWEFVGCIGAKNVVFDACTWKGISTARPGLLVYNTEQATISNCFVDHSILMVGGRGTYRVIGTQFEQSQLFVDQAKDLFVGGGTSFRQWGTNTGFNNGIKFKGGYKTGPDPETPWYVPRSTFAPADVTTATDVITLASTTTFPTGTSIRFTTTGTLPAGLSLLTDYFVINVSSTTIKVATSEANAIAGTAIDLTSQGTGTHTLTQNMIFSCDNVVIDGVIFRGFKDNAIYAKTTTESGKEVLDVRDITIANCKIENGTGIPVVAFADRIRISNTDILDANNNNISTTSYHFYLAAKELWIESTTASSPLVGTDIVFDHERYTSFFPTMKVRLCGNSLGSTTRYRWVNASGTLVTTNTGGVEFFGETGALYTALTTKTANYTLTATDSVILADATAGAVTMTLPSASGISGRQYTIKKIDSSANGVIVAGTIDGATNKVLGTQWQSMTVVSNGTSWFLL